MTEKVIETVNGWYMENPKQKVELDDIVGLVKTDEPTDSVQLKKEAQLSICEKRIIELEKENEQLKRQIGNLEHTKDFCADVCADCERLEKENEQLKQREQTLTAKIDRILHQRDGNEKQHLKVMSYLHDNYYSIWEECLKELGD